MNRTCLPLLAVILTSAANTCLASVPEGWGFHNPSSDYQVAKDEATKRDGLPGMAIRPLSKKPFEGNTGRFGILYQTVSAENYRGKRVRFSAWVKRQDVDLYSDLWMRVDGPDGSPSWYDAEKGKPLSFDRADMTGDGDWEWIAIVLDVPQKARAITFGYSLYGNGIVWANGLNFETVGKEIAATNRLKPPRQPVNTF